MDEKVFIRFAAKIKKGPGCWTWTSVVDGCGYGMLTIKGKKFKAHRLMHELKNGPIPKGLCVMHTCDNPPCVNPAHLKLGTHHENMLDRMRKGRGGDRTGEKNGRAKLKVAQVRVIRKSKLGPAALGRKYGVSRNQIWFIRTGKQWKGV